MDRRTFLRAGTAVAAGAVGVVGGSMRADARAAREHEEADYAVTGQGAVRVIWSMTCTDPVVALTFDDGPHPVFTPKILDLLAAHEVRATFFLVGRAAERHPDLVRRVLDAGHEVGNHTWSHPHIAAFDAVAARTEVQRGSEALERLTGTRPRWFRSPRGMLTGPILHAASDLGQTVAMWSARTPVDLLNRTSREITDHLVGALAPGAIFDLHDGTSGRDEDRDLSERRAHELPAYPAFFLEALEQGHRFLTLSEMDASASPGSDPADPDGAAASATA